jgi:hypothetical protein
VIDAVVGVSVGDATPCVIGDEARSVCGVGNADLWDFCDGRRTLSVNPCLCAQGVHYSLKLRITCVHAPY